MNGQDRGAPIQTGEPGAPPDYRGANALSTGHAGRAAPGYWQLVVAVAAVSFAAPLVKLSALAPVAVAFWRIALVAAGAGVLLLVRRRSLARASEHAVARAPSSRLAVLAGILLGLHFWVWIGSLQFTSVANSVLLVTTQPIWAAVISSFFLRQRIPALGWMGIALALAGSACTIGFAGVSLRGDLMALAGGVLAASYMVVGQHQRQTWEITEYLARVYGAATATLAIPLLLAHDGPIMPTSAREWGVLIALAAIPTGLGHTLYNWLLKHVPAYVVATSITGEPLGASLLAFWWLGEVPPARTVLLAPVILAGIILVARSQRTAVSLTAPPVT